MGEYAEYTIDETIGDWDGRTGIGINPYADFFNRGIIWFKYLSIKAETPKARLVEFNYSKKPHVCWIPKKRSQVNVEISEIGVEEWLLAEKIKEIKKARTP